MRVETVAAAPALGRRRPRRAPVVAPGSRPARSAAGAAGWVEAWQRAAAARVGAAVDAVLDAAPGLTAARLARDVVAALPSGALLVLGSSTPVRDVDRLAVPRRDVTVLANRGVAGHRRHDLDRGRRRAGARRGPAFALMGDLTFLHDLTGLLLGEGEPVPDLTVVVPDNDGGGIFAQLEPGEDRHARDYRRVFGTPARPGPGRGGARRWAGRRRAVRRAGELAGALALGGPRVVVVRTDQRAEAELARELRAGRGPRPAPDGPAGAPISCGSLAVSSREPCGRARIVVLVTGIAPGPGKSRRQT